MRLTSDINKASENPSETDKNGGTAEIDLDVCHAKRTNIEQNKKL